jgi:hypothetical protein
MLDPNKRYGGLSPYSDDVIVVKMPKSGSKPGNQSMINTHPRTPTPKKNTRSTGRLARGEHGLLGRKGIGKRR